MKVTKLRIENDPLWLGLWVSAWASVYLLKKRDLHLASLTGIFFNFWEAHDLGIVLMSVILIDNRDGNLNCYSIPAACKPFNFEQVCFLIYKMGI